MYFEPLGERNAVNTGVPCPKVPMHRKLGYKAEKGVSALQLQQWLGHANLNTTQIYVHLGKQNARKIMQDTSI